MCQRVTTNSFLGSTPGVTIFVTAVLVPEVLRSLPASHLRHPLPSRGRGPTRTSPSSISPYLPSVFPGARATQPQPLLSKVPKLQSSEYCSSRGLRILKGRGRFTLSRPPCQDRPHWDVPVATVKNSLPSRKDNFDTVLDPCPQK